MQRVHSKRSDEKSQYNPALSDAQRARLVEQIADPDVSSIRRRELRRRLHGITAVGTTDLRNPSPAPDAEAIARDRAELLRWHAARVEDEVANVERRIREIDARLAATPAGTVSEEVHEAQRERRMLHQLVGDLLADEPPERMPGSGRRYDAALRAMIARQADSLLRDNWFEADRLAASGDHREARMRRIDGLRARLVCEHNLGLRSSLPGYGSQPWS